MKPMRHAKDDDRMENAKGVAAVDMKVPMAGSHVGNGSGMAAANEGAGGHNSKRKWLPSVRFLAMLAVLSLLAWMFLFDGLERVETHHGVGAVPGEVSIGFIGTADALAASIDNSVNAGITTLEPDGSWKPSNLVSSFTAGDGGTVWTAKLNDGLRWSDGTTITSDAIMRSLKATLANGTYGARISEDLKAVSFDDVSRSVIFELRNPMAVFPYLLADPEYAIKPTHADDGRHGPVSSGAYTITGSQSGGMDITLTANRYCDAGQKAGVVHVHAYDTDDEGLQALDAGDVSYLVKDSAIKGNVDAARYDVRRGNGTRRTMIVFNGRLDVSQPILSDQHFRTGVSKALDSDALMRSLGDDGVVNRTPVVPGSLGFKDDNAAYAHDPAGGRLMTTSYFGVKDNRLLWKASRGHAFGEAVDGNLNAILQYTTWDEVDDATYARRMADRDYDMALVDMTGLDGFKDMLNGNALTSIDDQPAVSEAYDGIFAAADDNALVAAIDNAAIQEANACMADWLYVHRTTVISRKGIGAMDPDLIDVNMMLSEADGSGSE